MDLALTGKCAVVTGGSEGIGRAVASLLAANGVNVVITARDGQRLARTAEELCQAGSGKVHPIRCDMAKAADIAAAIEAARTMFGTIDIIVNNAGSSPAGRIDDLTDAHWYSSFELKLMGYVRCARAVLPEMRARRWGRIINVTGRGGDVPTAGYLLGAFNAAVSHFTRALALEAAPDNVLVNAVSPGAVNTPRWHSIIEQKAKMTGRSVGDTEAEMHANVPLGRAGAPEDIANLVAFLCSERARYISGALMNIDGGGARGV